jgi:hypothetical protein
MLQLGNQFSFMIAAVGLGLLLLFALWRWRKAQALLRVGVFVWYIFGVLLMSVLLRYPANGDVQSVAQVEQALANGRPTLVVLYSNYCLACMASLPAVRDLTPQLAAEGIDSLLIDIHNPPGDQLRERFGLSMTPTYVLYDASGAERLRSSSTPDLAGILSQL